MQTTAHSPRSRHTPHATHKRQAARSSRTHRIAKASAVLDGSLSALRAGLLAATSVALLAPSFAMAHTGTDGGAHHPLVDALLYALSDLSVPALLVALAIWATIFAASHHLKRRKQQATAGKTALRIKP